MANKIIRIATTTTEALKILWEEGFFKDWRKFSQIIEHLAKRGYNFSPPDLGMALGSAKYLTRRGKRGSYEYIQKYPYVKENPEIKSKNKNKINLWK